MIHPDEAVRLIRSLDCRLGSETLALSSALGRVPAEERLALLDQPPFDKSTMDGFAYASAGGAMADAGASFALVGSVAAGEPPPGSLAPGDCVRIMTGAPLPPGASAVHRLERAELSGGRVVLASREDDLNVVRRGANRRAGETLIPRRRLRPQDIALLASDGVAEIELVKKPRVAVISTGDELRAPSGPSVSPLEPGAIYDSNGPLLVAQAAVAGCDASFAGIVPDDEEALYDAIAAASAGADLLIVSGGVSAGDFDFVPAALERSGYAILFRGIAMRPGMPALLGRRGSGFAYGMPGNPVSAFVNFELIVKELLARFAGISYEPPLARALMGSTIRREVAQRVEFLPVELKAGIAYPLRYTGSTMLDALSRADALVRLEIGQSEIPEGAECLARLI